MGKPLVFHLRYVFRLLRIRSQYLNPGNFRPFGLFQSSTIPLAHSDERYMQNYGRFMETPIPRTWVGDAAPQSHSHTFERQGYEAGKVRRKNKPRGLAVRDRNISSKFRPAEDATRSGHCGSLVRSAFPAEELVRTRVCCLLASR